MMFRILFVATLLCLIHGAQAATWICPKCRDENGVRRFTCSSCNEPQPLQHKWVELLNSEGKIPGEWAELNDTFMILPREAETMFHVETGKTYFKKGTGLPKLPGCTRRL